MQTQDHLALGKYLLDQSDNFYLLRHRRAFLFGCVEPDYNIITYLRRSRGQQKFRGHNAENTYALISGLLRRFQTRGLKGGRDFFTLGVLLHYAADAFTWPHNACWRQNLRQHVLYEEELHESFRRYLEADCPGTLTMSMLCAPQTYFENCRAVYLHLRHGMEADCSCITGVCGGLLEYCLCYVREDDGEEALRYEGSYYHRLV